MWRIWTIFTVISCFFALITIRLFYWQVLRGDSLRIAASSQYFLEFPLPAERGNIYTGDNKPLVINQIAQLVYGQPQEIENKNIFAERVAKSLELDAKELDLQLADPNRVWVALAHKVEQKKVQELKELNLKGLGFEKEPKRFYPEASMAAHLLGFVGYDENGKDKGYFGLEGFYDRELRGKDGKLEREKDAHGAPILIGESRRIEPENGRSLVLWIDASLQRFVEDRLVEGIGKYGAKEGSVIVMDPHTGGILAMAAFPGYHPGSFTSFDKELYKNPLVADSFEPGSTFKILVMSAALEEKLVTPVTTVDEKGPVPVGDYSIRTWNNEYHGIMTMTQVLERSSNVGMVFVSQKLGTENLVRYVKLFGFGEPTNIDLEDEAATSLREESQWRDIDRATASFGQGIAVTPIQMVRAVSSLANGGWLMEPHVVREIVDSNRRVRVVQPKKVRKVISAQTAKIISEMMIAAVENGEAKWAKPKGYRIAGKTGTSQIPVAGHYDEDKTIASFIGFAPADNPRFVMLVTLREPTSSPWGSETAAPLFFTIARDIFGYYGIAPQ